MTKVICRFSDGTSQEVPISDGVLNTSLDFNKAVDISKKAIGDKEKEVVVYEIKDEFI